MFSTRAATTTRMLQIYGHIKSTPRFTSILPIMSTSHPKPNQPKASFASSTNMMREQFKRKEQVKEDLYIKQEVDEKQEEEWLEQVQLLHARQDSLRQKVFHDKMIQPIMKEIEDILQSTGDTISVQGLEKLAQWKKEG